MKPRAPEPTPNPKVDRLFHHSKWCAELEALRAIVLAFPLTEVIKWRQACYMLDGKNVLLLHGFKDYCALMIFKGALLKDTKKLLKTPGAHQAVRQLRFTNLSEIVRLKTTIKAYIKETLELERSGAKVQLKKTEDFPLPAELVAKFKASPAFKKAFAALTPGRQRGYILHFSRAKQSATRTSRIETCTPKIIAGKGLDDMR